MNSNDDEEHYVTKYAISTTEDEEYGVRKNQLRQLKHHLVLHPQLIQLYHHVLLQYFNLLLLQIFQVLKYPLVIINLCNKETITSDN